MNNTKRNKTLLIIAIILLAANLTMLTLNWLKKPICKDDIKKERTHKLYKKGFNDRIADELKLSDIQKKHYKELKEKHFEKIEVLRDSIRRNKKRIHNELLKDEPSIAYINQLADSIGMLNSEFEKLNYLHFFEISQELTTIQKERFKVLIKKLPHGKEGHRKRFKANPKE